MKKYVYRLLPKLKLLNMSNIFAMSIRPAYFPLFQPFINLRLDLEVAFEMIARLAGYGGAASSSSVSL